MRDEDLSWNPIHCAHHHCPWGMGLILSFFFKRFLAVACAGILKGAGHYKEGRHPVDGGAPIFCDKVYNIALSMDRASGGWRGALFSQRGAITRQVAVGAFTSRRGAVTRPNGCHHYTEDTPTITSPMGSPH